MTTPTAASNPGSAEGGEQSVPSVQWSGRSRGGYWGNWFFIQLVRLAGLRVAYLWLLPVAAYFTCTSRLPYRCSVDFLRRVLGPQQIWKWPLLVYRHFLSQGVSLLDRIAVIMGRQQIECSFEGEALFREHLSPKQGIILLAAHLGSWELGGHVLGRLQTPVNLVVLDHEEEKVRQLFGQALQERRFKLIATDGHPLRSIPIAAALKRGEIVALQGDRSFGGQDVAVPFLGNEARFPVGAYLLAAATGAPIFQVFVVRERLKRYRFVSFPPLFVERDLLRQPVEALGQIVEQYAERLGSMARQYPFQWYNFYPFWESKTGEQNPHHPRRTST